MVHAIRKLYRPEFYQGPRRPARYFEGWYYKLVSPRRACALIPGISWAPDDPHAFVQVIDGTHEWSRYYRFPADAFSHDSRVFEVRVGPNRFSLEGLHAELDGFEADAVFERPSLWRGTLLQPGTMGWYSFVPFMECKHGIIVMDARAAGALDGVPFDGRLYLEKDYGRSFPNAWIWLQSNSFERPGVSVTCSIANVPFVGGAFTGFLAGIAVDGEVWKFTTYTGCRIESLEVRERTVDIVLARGTERRLELHAVREQGSQLVSPQEGAMRGRIVESLRSSVDARLTVDGSVVYEGSGTSAGLEVVNPDRLLLNRPRRARRR